MASWTHRICTACWLLKNGDRLPVRLRLADAGVCCVCGQPDAHDDGAIYFRAKADDLHCKGQGPEHEDSKP